jgi:hypothetical protein
VILDNRRMAMIEDAQVRNYRPTFVIDQTGIMQYDDAPLPADLAGVDPALATLAPADPAPIDPAPPMALNTGAGSIPPSNRNVSVCNRIGARPVIRATPAGISVIASA